MGKQRNITPQVAKSYDDAFEAFNEVVKKGKGNTGFGSLGSSAASTFRGYDTGIGDSKYDKGLSWNANIDEDNVKGSINEFRSEQQGGWAETGAFLGRVGTKVGTELVKTVGAIGGTLVGLAENTQDLITDEDKHTFLETAFNNDFIKAAEKIQKSINNEYLPVYVSEIVENGDFLDKVTSGEFWATEGADGVGYLISALAPGAAFKALGGSAKLFGGAVKSLQYARYGKGIEGARKALTAAGVTIDKIDSITIPALNTYFEAGAEAKGAGDSMEFKKPEYIKKYTEKYLKELSKTTPQYIDVPGSIVTGPDGLQHGTFPHKELNPEYLLLQEKALEMAEKEFQDQKGKAMRNVFLTNVGILALPNYIQAKMLFGKTPSRLLLDKITGEVAEKSIKNTAKQGLKNVGKSFLTEGSEEIAQTSTEQRNVDRGLNNELEEFYLTRSKRSAEDIFTFGEDFVKSLGTTEGQVAGFLGGFLGSPISVYTGYKQDLKDRKNTERLKDKINGQSSALQDIYNTPLYETEEVTDPKTGEKITIDKEVDGKKVFIPENVAKVKKALDFQEQLSKVYDQAVEEGDIDTINYLKKQAEFNVITNFISEDKVTLDALKQHLDVIFPVIEKNEDGSVLTQEQVKQNTENKERLHSVINKASVLQEDLASFKDMSQSIIRLKNPEASKEQVADFLNNIAFAFISERSEEYDLQQKHKELKLKQAELQKQMRVPFFQSNSIDISKQEELLKEKEINNPRLNSINEQIKKVEDQLDNFNETTNELIWNNEFLNKQLDNRVKAEKKLKEANTPEAIAKNDEAMTQVNNATSKEDLDNIPKTNTAGDKIIEQKKKEKAEQIKASEQVINDAEIAEAKQEDEDFNTTVNYIDLIATEGSNVSDELTPKEGDNNTPEELEKVKNEEESAGKGAQIISTYRNDDKKGRWKSGDIIPFMKEQFSNFLKYEKEPIDKSGKFVTFEVNNNPGPNENVNEALNLYKEFLKRGFTNMTIDEYTLLYEYLPINVRFTPEVNAPIETKRIATFDKETNEWVEKMNISTGLLRTELINNLRNGISFENMSTTIQDQYKGVLKIDSDTAENNLLQLDGVKDLKYIRDNLFVVNSQGNLQNILTSKIENFTNGKIKPNAAGEIYLMIPQANGKPFPLKLNIKKISESEAVLLYYIYREILLNDKALDTTVSQVNDELNALIKNTFKAELDIIGGNEDDIKLQTIIDLLIYQSDNIKSRMQIDKDADGNTVLLYSNGQDGKVATKETIEEDLGAIIDYLENHKRHQIKINPKFATDNTKTNLKSNSADYLKYLIDNNILSTNAVVNEPTFQGYTNIYLNTGVIVNNQTQPTEKVAEVSPEVADIERRKQDFIKTSIERKGSKLNELEIKAIEDKFNVELQALGQQSTTSNQSEIEAKKADIERRRQEELKSEERRTAESIHEVEFEDGNGDMTKAKVIFYKDGNGKIIQYDVDGERVPGEIKINKELREITKDNPEEIVNRALGENAKTISSQTENIDNAIVNKINAKYDSELKTLENKSENVRNSQENFVSLSEIPGTVENTELKETQEKVIKKQRSPKERQTDFRRMDALFKKKSEKGLTTEKELRDFEMFKEMYPQEFEKRCK